MSTTWLDRTIGWLAPTAGARRAQSRLMMETLAFEGAKQTRRTAGWSTGPMDADAESQGVVHTLRNRGRDLVRNNPYAASYVDIRETEVIGSGIKADIDHKSLAERWKIFVENCDADGDRDFYGLQSLAERCRGESGEVLIRRFPVERTPDELRMGMVAMQLRVLEPDYIDVSRDGTAENGNAIRYGIEYDIGQRIVAYYLYDRHPGEASVADFRSLSISSTRVPATDVLHLFRKHRPGQSRGVTDFAPVMVRLRELDDYDDAEVVRKKIEACLAAFVTSPSGNQASPIGPVSTDTNGRVERFSPGMIKYMKYGEDVKIAEPKSSGGYADFKRFSARDIASGLSVPYELLTGDLSQVNYSSYRAGLVRFRRRIEKDQKQLYVFGLCGPVFSWFHAESRFAANRPGLGAKVRPSWTPPRFELIDPLKETLAEMEAVLAGFDTWPEVVRRRGWTASEQLDVIANWQDELAGRGIVLKSDHRSAVSMGRPAPPPDDEEEGEEAA